MLRFAIALLGYFALASAAFSQAWPSRPIHYIVPVAPGGNSDALARLIASKLQTSLGQSVVVENKPGGDSIPASAFVAQAAPDGYTIGNFTDTLAIHEASNVPRPYDPVRDIAMIIKIVDIPLSFIVNNEKVPQQTLSQLVAYAKAHPKWLTFGSLGPGSLQDILFRQFERMAGFEGVIVPYRGGTPALQDTLAGHVLSTLRGGTLAEDVGSGLARRIAVTAEARLARLPNIPTMKEQGIPIVATGYHAVGAPSKTPSDIIVRLNSEINRALQSPEIREFVYKNGLDPGGGSVEEITTRLAKDMVTFKKIVAEQKILLK